MNKIIIIVLVLVIVGGLAYVVITATPAVPPVTPPPIVEEPAERLPRVTYPQPNQLVESPLQVVGEAPGTWFFEASLPVSLLDGNGRQIAIVPAQAEGDWMTTEYVSFRTTINFDSASTTTETGSLIIAKDNPSGLPENDQQISIPIRFKGQTESVL